MENGPMRKYKIAIVLASLGAGGAETRMLDILKNIDRSTFQLDFIVLSKDGKQFYDDEVLSLGANIIRLDSPQKVSIYKHILQMKRTFQNGGYTAVHANTSYHCGVVLKAASDAHVPVRIAHARTNELRKKGLKEQLVSRVGKMLIKVYATNRLAISKESGDYLYGKHQRYVVLPNAIQISAFSEPNFDLIELLKNQYHIDDSKIVIGHVGRFDQAKNQIFLIRVFAEYQKTNPNSVLVLIGDGQKREECEMMASELNIQKSVIFLGKRKDVNVWMNIFDIFVFPSLYEGLGNVAIEAQAAGVPCLCSDRVPRSVDMSLGLTDFIDIQMGEKFWCEKITEMLEKQHPSVQSIYEAFEEKNYTIDAAVKTLSQIYSQETR